MEKRSPIAVKLQLSGGRKERLDNLTCNFDPSSLGFWPSLPEVPRPFPNTFLHAASLVRQGVEAGAQRERGGGSQSEIERAPALADH